MGTASFEEICAYDLPGTLNLSSVINLTGKDVIRDASSGRHRKTLLTDK